MGLDNPIDITEDDGDEGALAAEADIKHTIEKWTVENEITLSQIGKDVTFKEDTKSV